MKFEFEKIFRQLQAEYDRLKGLQATISTPHLPMTNGSLGRRGLALGSSHTSTGSLPHSPYAGLRGTNGHELSEEDLLAEARALRQHKSRLEARMTVLEDHNRQLEAQLSRLKHIIEEAGTEMSSSVVSANSTTTPYSSLQRNAFRLNQNGHSTHAIDQHGKFLLILYLDVS